MKRCNLSKLKKKKRLVNIEKRLQGLSFEVHFKIMRIFVYYLTFRKLRFVRMKIINSPFFILPDEII